MANVILGVTIENMREFRGMGIRFAAEKKETLKATAVEWHTSLLDGHFTPGNTGRYGLKNRTQWYLDKIKKPFGQGQGKWVLLKLTEKSQRWMNVFATVSGTSSVQTIRMRPPIYFGSPFIGSWVDKRGKTKKVTQQPDKPGEVTRVNDRDRAYLKEFMQKRLQRRIGTIVRMNNFLGS